MPCNLRNLRNLWLLLAVLVALPAAAQFGGSAFQWFSAGPANTAARISGVAADPRSPTGLFMSAAGGGLWRSADTGTSWTSISDTAPTLQVCTFIFDPANPDTLYAGTGDEGAVRPNQGLMRSTDGGISWSLTQTFSSQPVCALALDPFTGSRMLAASQDGLFLSTNGGTTWTRTASSGGYSLVFDGTTNGIAYAAISSPNFFGNVSAPSPLLKSTDGGATWNQVPLPLIDPTVGRLFQRGAVAVGDAGRIYLALSYTIGAFAFVDLYNSADGGATWTVFERAGTGGGRVAMVYDSVNKSLYLGAGNLVRSGPDATAFTVLKTASVSAINAVTLLSTSVVVAGDNGLDVVPVSAFGTVPPAPVVLSLPALSQVLSVQSDPVNAAVMYAGGEDGLRILTPGGGWKRVLTTGVGAIQVSGGSPQNIYALSSQTFFRSTDGGTTFKNFTAITPGEPRAPYPPLLMDPVATAQLFTGGRRIFRSLDNGQTWAPNSPVIDPDPSTVLVSLAFSPLVRQIMYAATACLGAVSSTCQAQSHLFISQNSGATWTPIAALSGYVTKLVVDPRVAQQVYAVTGSFPGGPSNVAGNFPGAIFRVAIGAAPAPGGGGAAVTVTSLRGNLPTAPLNGLAVPNPGAGAATTPATTYYASGDAGVFATFNSGQSWVAINTGLPPVTVTDLNVRGTTMRAATYGRGIFQASTTNISSSPVLSTLNLSVFVIQGQKTSIPISVSNTSTTDLSFTVRVNDAWLTVSPSSAGLETSTTVTVTVTVDASTLSPGVYKTRLTVVRPASVASPAAFGQDIFLTATVTTAPASLTAVAGDGATAAAGSPVVLTVAAVDATGSPLPNLAVQFRIASGAGQLSTPSSVTDTLGRASVTLTLPSTAGTVTAMATAAGLNASFTVTAVRQVQPRLSSGAAVNAASFAAGGSVAPGAIISIFGAELASGTGSASSLPLPTELGGAQVLIGGVAAPLFFASAAQINAQVPFEVSPGSGTLVVQYAGPSGLIPSNTIELSIAAAGPGVFTVSRDGRGPGVFIRSDSVLVDSFHPAARNSVLTFYATGLGAVDPPVVSGTAALGPPSLSRTVATPNVNIGGSEAEVLFSGLAPGFVGLYQINVRVPATLPPGANVPVTLRVGTALSNTVTLAVN